jgi:CelD/BcsL family acetyltransferase involved in cellulose biosynthesis
MQTQVSQQSQQFITTSTQKGLSVIKVDNFSDLLSIQDQWNDTLHKSDSDSPFLTFEWLSSWWNHFSRGSRLFVLVVKEDDRITAIAPLMIIKRRLFRVIQFIGTGRSDYLDFIVAEKRQESLKAIFKYLRASKKLWDIMQLQDIASDSPNLEVMNSEIADAGMVTDAIVANVAPYLPINSGWQDYLLNKPGKFRNDIRRVEKKLKEAGDFQITHQNAAALEQIRVIESIEKQSWKADAGCCRLSESNAFGFYAEFIEKFSQKNWLDLWFLKLGQEAIAYSVNFCYGNKIYNYNVAYVSEHKALYPGKALTISILKDAFNRNMKEYDFLKGDESYKSAWTSHKRDLHCVAIYRKDLYSLVTYFLLVKLRQILQKISFVLKH